MYNISRFCHLSIDDVTKCFQYLIKYKNTIHSIFDNQFLGYLRELHYKYYCKFTLYVYLKDGDFNISDVPDYWKKEFDDNSDWLKIGFHSVSSKKLCREDWTFFFEGFNEFCNAVNFFAGDKVIAKYLRLDFFYAELDWVDYLRQQGIRCMLSADDNRISYCLPYKENCVLSSEGTLKYHGMVYLRSDIRIEGKKNVFTRICGKLRGGGATFSDFYS